MLLRENTVNAGTLPRYWEDKKFKKYTRNLPKSIIFQVGFYKNFKILSIKGEANMMNLNLTFQND